MEEYTLTEGEGRTSISLIAENMGDDRIITVRNQKAHIGAIALGEYDFANERASVSVITRLGHKDDAIARQAAYSISKRLKKSVCVIAGVHVDNITGDEIEKILENSARAVEKYIDFELGEES